MIEWTEHATTKLHHIHDYIAQDSSLYPKRVSDALVHKTFMLNESPRMGHKVPELDDEIVREAIVVLLPQPLRNQDPPIDILAVIHNRRNLQV